MESQPLKDRVAIVTGGSSGIGRGICIELAREGAHVVIADIQETPKQGRYYETDTQSPTVLEIEKLGGKAIFVQTDVSSEIEMQRLIDQAAAHFGRLDILVNNAGIMIPGGYPDLAVADWDRVLDVNLKSIFLAVQIALPHLKKSPAGRIINISSVNALRGGGGPSYTASKAGAVNLTRDTAVALGPEGITVNAILPGAVETAMQDLSDEENQARERRGTPLQRFGTPRDIGRACVFLASDDAAWITGVALPVDGGLLSGWAR